MLVRARKYIFCVPCLEDVGLCGIRVQLEMTPVSIRMTCTGLQTRQGDRPSGLQTDTSVHSHDRAGNR